MGDLRDQFELALLGLLADDLQGLVVAQADEMTTADAGFEDGRQRAAALRWPLMLLLGKVPGWRGRATRWQ